MRVSFRGGVENMNLTLYVNTADANTHTLDLGRHRLESPIEETINLTVCYSEPLRITDWQRETSFRRDERLECALRRPTTRQRQTEQHSDTPTAPP